MEKENTEEKNKNKNQDKSEGQENNGKEKEQRLEEVVKITMSKEAETQLTRVMERVNDGFEAGRINRQELASWAVLRFAQECNADVIRSIRQEHFDEVAFLESVLRRGKETGKLPQEIRNALKLHLGMEPQSKKPSKRALTQDYINDVVLADGQVQANS